MGIISFVNLTFQHPVAKLMLKHDYVKYYCCDDMINISFCVWAY